MTATRPSIWKLKVKVLPFSSSKTSAGETLAALFDSSGICKPSPRVWEVCREPARARRQADFAQARSGGGILTESAVPRSLTVNFADAPTARGKNKGGWTE